MHRKTKRNRETFEDGILLRINREYSKEESVAFLLGEIAKLKQELSKSEFQKGELVSQNAELADEVNRLKNTLKTHATNFNNLKLMNRGLREENDKLQQVDQKQIKRESLQTEIAKENVSLKKKNMLLGKEVTTWRNKYYSIKGPVTAVNSS